MRRREFGFLGAAGLATAAIRPAAAQNVSGQLVLYTSQLEPDAAGTVDAFRRRHPGVQVEWIRGGTGQIWAAPSRPKRADWVALGILAALSALAIVVEIRGLG
jgi:hypothetical protein